MKKNKEIKWILLAGGIVMTVIFTVTAYFLRKQNRLIFSEDYINYNYKNDKL